MKLNTFLKQFDKITDNNERKEFLNKHLKRNYIPFIDRNNAAHRTVMATHIVDDKYKPNTQLFEMFKDLDFIELFTDIEFDRIVNGQTVSAEIYDDMMSRGIIDGFKALLTFDQRDVWESTYYDTIDDIKYRMTSTVAIIDSTADRIASFYEVVDQWVNQAIDRLAEVSQGQE